ncbi:hypothetical protein O181_099121 [Austropuccinia psidii MF-1]|uniref:Uncharacterized protein n=1 Tax=Austropuccinia psidii MF-1 TaxID=1389203 RepID=A0A9Q3JC85_9BASI|nr:hypothetical protein [Austropuccinia psidii MF-1]
MVISTYQHIITSSGHPIIQRTHQGSRASVSASKTNHAIKTSLDNFIHSIPPRKYCSNIHIWAHNAHLRILFMFVHLRICTLFAPFAHLRTLTQSVQKTLSRPLGQFLAQNPKVAKNPKGPRNTFPSSEAITSIFLPSAFPSQDLWT